MKATTLARASAALAVTAAACALGFRVIGSHVDDHGVLHEPFALVAISYLCAAGTLMTGGAALLSSKKPGRT